MSCNCCNGVGHNFTARNMNCKIVIRDGNVLTVCLPNNATDVEVKFCPLCGRLLDTPSNELPLSPGDNIWYIDVDSDECVPEHGVIEYISIENGTLIDYACVKFDNGDIDDFGPNGFGNYYFRTEEEARKAWEKMHE